MCRLIGQRIPKSIDGSLHADPRPVFVEADSEAQADHVAPDVFQS
jgi:hypothetical protein